MKRYGAYAHQGCVEFPERETGMIVFYEPWMDEAEKRHVNAIIIEATKQAVTKEWHEELENKMREAIKRQQDKLEELKAGRKEPTICVKCEHFYGYMATSWGCVNHLCEHGTFDCITGLHKISSCKFKNKDGNCQDFKPKKD